jgi:hypothetical protein
MDSPFPARFPLPLSGKPLPAHKATLCHSTRDAFDNQKADWVHDMCRHAAARAVRRKRRGIFFCQPTSCSPQPCSTGPGLSAHKPASGDKMKGGWLTEWGKTSTEIPHIDYQMEFGHSHPLFSTSLSMLASLIATQCARGNRTWERQREALHESVGRGCCLWRKQTVNTNNGHNT